MKRANFSTNFSAPSPESIKPGLRVSKKEFYSSKSPLRIDNSSNIKISGEPLNGVKSSEFFGVVLGFKLIFRDDLRHDWLADSI